MLNKNSLCKFIQALKLSKGMMRVFIALAVIISFAALHYTWGDVQKIQKRKQGLFAREQGGIAITAITTGYTLIGGGQEKRVGHSPKNTWVASGWATYLCYSSITGRYLFVEGSDFNRVVHTKISAKEFYKITRTDKFKSCLKNQAKIVKNELTEAYAKVFLVQLFCLLCLYLILLSSALVINWVMDGFK